MVIKKGRNWNLPENNVISESRHLNRRQFLKLMGYGAAGLGIGGSILAGCVDTRDSKKSEEIDPAIKSKIPEWINDLYPADPNPEFDQVPSEREMTPPEIAGTFNNFYEFGINKRQVHENAKSLVTRPWTVEIGGLVHNPKTLDVDDFYKLFDLEERIYRHRCVEAWSMVVPWIGYPMRKLLDYVQPMQDARYVKMITFYRPSEAIGQRELTQYTWPYYEALTIEEAANDLTMLVTGIFGYVTPSQYGAPFRLVVPWKYGLKSIKSIVKIEFVKERPKTFWSDISPNEYGFSSNVDPDVPHPRWSQAMEIDIGTEKLIETLPFNGYGQWVADLYK